MINDVYIAWRKKAGDRRHIIARIRRNSEGILFRYLDEFKNAQKDGLDHFLGFKEEKKLDPQEIESLLSFRLISKDRPDRKEFLNFWEADGLTDTLDLLAFTQGKSPSDNFEFLGDFFKVKGSVSFITDLAALTHHQLPKGRLKKGDSLYYKREPENVFDRKAVAIYHNGLKIGYIKRIHNKIFSLRRTLFLTVKEVDDVGSLKQIFVRVEKKNI